VQDDEGEKLDASGFVGRIETCHVVRKAHDVRPVRSGSRLELRGQAERLAELVSEDTVSAFLSVHTRELICEVTTRCYYGI